MSLFTSIRNLAKTAAAVAAPIVGTAYGGPQGGMFGAAVSQQLIGAGPPTPPGGGAGTNAAVYGGSGSTSSEWGGTMTVGAAGSWGSPASKWLISAKGIVTTIAGRILGVMQGTKLLRLPAVVALVRSVGPQAAALGLGLAVAEVANLVAAHFTQHHRRRRGRGISSRDIRCTRRTLHKIRSIEHSLHLPRAAPRARRSSAGASNVRLG